MNIKYQIKPQEPKLLNKNKAIKLNSRPSNDIMVGNNDRATDNDYMEFDEVSLNYANSTQKDKDLVKGWKKKSKERLKLLNKS